MIQISTPLIVASTDQPDYFELVSVPWHPTSLNSNDNRKNWRVDRNKSRPKQDEIVTCCEIGAQTNQWKDEDDGLHIFKFVMELGVDGARIHITTTTTTKYTLQYILRITKYW